MGMCTLSCCCCIITLVVILALGGGFGTWFFVTIARVSDLKAVNYQVTNASLTQFDFSTANQTDYNLALDLTLENPSKKVSWEYDGIKASASFKNQALNTVTFESFNLGKGEKVVFSASFQGQRPVRLPVDEVSRFKNNPADFDILLSLDITNYYHILSRKLKAPPKVDCNLKVPLKSNGNSGEGFKVSECKYQK